MELSDIRQLALLMKEAGIKRLDYTAGDARIVLEREGGETPAAAEPAAQTTCASAESGHAAANLYTVTSPMVGVFYAAPAPDEPPFVSIGDKVEPGDTLCIIEAMKMMNEITAVWRRWWWKSAWETSKIVEFGYPLFRLRLTAAGRRQHESRGNHAPSPAPDAIPSSTGGIAGRKAYGVCRVRGDMVPARHFREPRRPRRDSVRDARPVMRPARRRRRGATPILRASTAC